MARCEFLLEPYTDTWVEEGGILAVRPVGTRVSGAEWTAWVRGSSAPPLAGVPTNTQQYITRAMHRQRLLESLSGDHMAFYAAAMGVTEVDEEKALIMAGEVDSFKAKVLAYGWDSNWGFEELRRAGVLMFDADPALIPEYTCGKEEFTPSETGALVRTAKRLYRVDFRATLSGASLNNFLDVGKYVEPNRNFPNITAPVLEVTTIRNLSQSIAMEPQ